MSRTSSTLLRALVFACVLAALPAIAWAGCVGDGQCSEPRPYCNSQTGNCEACIIDSHCAEFFPSGGACTSNFVCVECVEDIHCPTQEVCDPFQNRCVECTTSSHCGSTQFCAIGNTCQQIQCVEGNPCWSHDDCGGLAAGGWCEKGEMECTCS